MRADLIHHTNTVRRFIIAGGRRHFIASGEEGLFCGPGQANGQRSAREEPNSFYERSRVERDLGHRSGPTVADSEAIRKRLAGEHIGWCTLVNSLSRHLLEPDFWPGIIHGLPVTRAQFRWTSAIGCELDELCGRRLHFQLGSVLFHDLRGGPQDLGNHCIDIRILCKVIHDAGSEAEFSLQFRVREINFPATHNTF